MAKEKQFGRNAVLNKHDLKKKYFFQQYRKKQKIKYQKSKKQ